MDAFEARYRTLAVTTCEWRAFEVADPETLADRVFAALRSRRGAPTLKSFYKVVEDVVAKAYMEASSQTPLIEGIMRGQLSPFMNRRPKTDQARARAALAALRAREVDVLRQAVWDCLTPQEMAEVNGGTPQAQTTRVDNALRRYASKLPAESGADPRAVLEELHPGTHRR